MVLTFAAGCASSDKNVKTGQLLRIGVCPNYLPIIYKENGKICGVEADLANYISDKLNAPIEFVELPFVELIPNVETGGVDIVMSALSVTEKRKKKVRFVEPYLNIGLMALIRTSETGKFNACHKIYETKFRVACQKGTTAEKFMRNQT